MKMIREAVTGDLVTGYNKHSEYSNELKLGGIEMGLRGLEDRMQVDDSQFHDRLGKGVEGIQAEVDEFALDSLDPDAIELQESLHYIRNEPASEKMFPTGIRDHGRGAVRLDYFLSHRDAQKANLSEAEVVALRLYTMIAFIFTNRPLRDVDRYSSSHPVPLSVTTYFADKGIKKLRVLATPRTLQQSLWTMTFWRGIRNVEVSDEFMQQGGTEPGFMSTAKDVGVAVRYSLGSNSLLLKIVAEGPHSFGVDVKWLSAFPDEEEVLYPPLTYLKPTGRTQVTTLCALSSNLQVSPTSNYISQ